MAQLFGDPSLPRLPVLIEWMRQGDLQIPLFQREFVWTDTQRVDLLDSIYQMLPIGSLLVWRTSAYPDLARHPKLGPFELAGPRDERVRNYVLDGLQRVTTLYCALTRPPDGDLEDDEGTRWPLLCDLGSDEIRFLVQPRRRPPSPSQIPVWQIFDDEAFDQFRRKLPDGDPVRKRLRAVETRFRDYVFPLVPLLTDQLAQVKSAFVRVNSSGTSISESAMVRAFSWTREFDLEDRFDQVRNALGASPWGLLEGDEILAILKVLLKVDVYKADPKHLGVKLQESDARLLEELPGLILQAGELVEGWGVGGPRALPYIYLFAGLCAALRVLREPDDVVRERLRRWFFTNAYAESLSGATSGQIYRVLAGAADPNANPSPLADATTVAPSRKVNTNSVRGRLALLSLARSGGAQPGANELPRRFGEGGSNVVLSLRNAPGPLAERMIATAEERARLRALLLRPPTLPTPEDQHLLRCHLFIGRNDDWLPDVPLEQVLEHRQLRLERLERDFVLGLGLIWKP